MDLTITGWKGARDYRATKPTYAIRIYSAIDPFDYPLPFEFPLHDSPLLTIDKYVFDDVWPGGFIPAGSRIFEDTLARRILTDFQNRGRTKEALLVHCSRGMNRSPAVGIALNAIFKLGYDPEVLKRQYPHTNRYIYDTLIHVARKMRL